VEATPGQVLREARRRHGLSQARLAIRAGTTQSAISRIEKDQVSPTVETLRSLLHLLGEELQLGVAESNSGVDRSMVRERLRMSPSERLEYGRRFADYVIENSPNARRGTAAA
jgi:transcriptional regulator with XRE-family HTH domain